MNKDMGVEAYPLHWPAGYERNTSRQDSRFKTTFGRARNELVEEIRKLGGRNMIISTNIPLKNDGMPYANFKTPNDPGVAVYFTYNGKQMVFACDKWKKIEENLWSVCCTINAIRGIERWGSSDMLERAFTGFMQLEAPRAEDCWSILGCTPKGSMSDIKNAYHKKIREVHPDNGGSAEAAAKVNKAYEEATASWNKANENYNSHFRS